jgi:protein involved in polysaccharide export with SLBB domain
LAVAGLALPLLPTAAQEKPAAAAEETGRSGTGLWHELETTRGRIQFERAALDDWMGHFAAATGHAFAASEAVRGLGEDRTTLVSVSLPEMSARRALDVVTDLLDLDWCARGDKVLIDVAKPGVQLAGEVRLAGWIELRGRLTLLELLAKAGITEAADIEHVLLIRPRPMAATTSLGRTEPLTMEINFREMVLTGNTTYNVQLSAGDLVVVPAKPGAAVHSAHTKPEYLTAGDSVVFFVEPTLLVQPGFEQLALLTAPQQVGIDGTIHLPYIGNLMVLGLTERELETLVVQQLQGPYKIPIRLRARFSSDPSPQGFGTRVGAPK